MYGGKFKIKPPTQNNVDKKELIAPLRFMLQAE
jgi:hypothetical protein